MQLVYLRHDLDRRADDAFGSATIAHPANGYDFTALDDDATDSPPSI